MHRINRYSDFESDSPTFVYIYIWSVFTCAWLRWGVRNPNTCVCVRMFGLGFKNLNESYLMVHCQEHEMRFAFKGKLKVRCRNESCYSVVYYALTTSSPLNSLKIRKWRSVSDHLICSISFISICKIQFYIIFFCYWYIITKKNIKFNYLYPLK